MSPSHGRNNFGPRLGFAWTPFERTGCAGRAPNGNRSSNAFGTITATYEPWTVQLEVKLIFRSQCGGAEVTLESGRRAMLGLHVPAFPPAGPPVEHLHGFDALPRVVETLTRFEPAVLLTADGRGAIYAPVADRDGPPQRFWLLADARTAVEWEADRRHAITLSFLSRDEHTYLQVAGEAQLVTEPGVADTLWRHSFQRWFPGGPADPRLMLVLFTATSAEFYENRTGRVTHM
ncbi:MAG: pyridoxamine 5'-phosphate oxidase family protein [Vicinamibacterales bacterium]